MTNDETKGVRGSGRRLAAIMFTDMVGYSALSQRDEAAAMRALSAQTRLMEPVLVVHGGRLVRTMGDGAFVEFGSAVSACKAALEIQEAVALYNESASDKFQIRIGIHLGDVEVADGDLLGHGVNVAARIEPLAEPGGVCVSEDVARQVKGKFAVDLVNMGEKVLKGIEGGVGVYRMSVKQAVAHRNVISEAQKFPTIGVLPLENLSPDPENAFFSDGLTEEILSALSKIRTLRVVSRTSCFALRGTTKPAQEVGKILGVDHLLVGSVRKAGNRIRVAVQLVDIAKDRPLWSEKYDRDLEDIFAIQEEITGSIIEVLQIAISESERGAIGGVPTMNLKAYESYLRGWSLSWTNLNEAIKHYQDAIRLDPKFAKAHASLATCAIINFRFFGGDDQNYVRIANESARTAIGLDPGLAEAQVAVAEVAQQENRIDDAVAAFETALSIDPRNYDALYNYGRLLSVLGDEEKAIQMYTTASETQPDEYQATTFVAGIIFRHSGREAATPVMQSAIERVTKRIRCCPTDARAYILGALTLEGLGESDAALKWANRAYEIDQGGGTLYNLSCFYRNRGDNEKAISLLETAYERGLNFTAWLRRDPDMEVIRDDPRVQDLMEKMDVRMGRG